MNKLITSALAAVLAFSLIGCTPPADDPAQQPAEQPGQASARADFLVTVDEFDTEGVTVLDARAPEAYAAGHIPGAINTPWQTFSNMEGAPGEPEWGTLLAADEIANRLGELGVDANQPIVVYADPTGWGEDGRVAWTLRTAGIGDQVRMLDGGYPAWESAGGEPSTEAPELEPTEVTAANGDDSLTVATQYLSENLENVTIIDTRATGEFEGAQDFGEARGGRIPGAVSIPYVELFNDDGTVKSDDDLRAMFEDAGMETGDEVVFYCTAGIRSAHMTLIARMLGYDDAGNYDASFYAWAADESLPVE